MLDGTFSVADLLAAVELAVATCFPDEVWVEGEIADLQAVRLPDGGRHVYFSLVTPAADDPARPSARGRLPVKLFDPQRRGVNHRLRREGAVKMADGARIRVRGRVELYGPRSEIQLRMTGIDPTYTLGVLASERDRLLRLLEAEGLLRANAGVPMPVLPLRVGLVTAAASAAEADVLHELKASGIGWHVAVRHVRVQGPTAGREVAAAVSGLAGWGVDVVAVVRGGGARTELAGFDEEVVARAIATCPVPVVTGIGHEVDESVADRVAHRSFKTPTAAAAGLVTMVRAASERVEAAWLGAAAGARLLATRSADHVERSCGRLATGARLHALAHRRHLDAQAARLAVAPRRRLGTEDARLEAMGARAAPHDPARVLRRGFSVTRGPDGLALRDASRLQPGDEVLTELAAGRVASRVSQVEAAGP